jgi:nitrogen fixation/metabolism regulation signal transduction histidine kinase
MESLKMTLGSNFDGFWKIYTDVRNEKKASGYYRWKEKDGRIRDKYMVCNPIPGTPYVIAATTYIDEFTQPVKEMGKRMEGQIQETRHFVFLVFGTAMVFIAIVVSIYGHRLTGRIQSLTDAANRISVGDLQMEIDVKSGDEIGELADAISRMQESIRLSIERLRLRR